MERLTQTQTVTEEQIFCDLIDDISCFDQALAHQSVTQGLGALPNATLLPFLKDRTSRASNSQTLSTVWNFLSDWVRAQVAMDAPASIPGFGTITQQSEEVLLFEPDPTFLDRHALKVERDFSFLEGTKKSPNISFEDQREYDADLFLFNFVEMAACCASDSGGQAKAWLDVLLQTLGFALKNHDKIELDIGSGIICCDNKKISRHMKQKEMRDLDALHDDLFTKIRIPRRPSAFDHVKHSDALPTRSHTRKLKDSAPQRTESPRQIKLNRSFESVRKQQNLCTHSTSCDEPSGIFVPLFDKMGQTLCVEPDMRTAMAPSNRIGSNYTPTALQLCMHRGPTSAGISLNNESFNRGEVHEWSQAVIADEVEASDNRYMTYLNELDEYDHLQWQITPPSCDLIDSIFQASKRHLNVLLDHPKTFNDQLISTLRVELARRYTRSTRKAVLNYILLRDTTRKRLQIYHGSPSSMVLPNNFVWNNLTGDEYGCLSDLKALTSSTPTKALTSNLRQTGCMIKDSTSPRSLINLLWILSKPQAYTVLKTSYAVLESIQLFDLPSLEALSNFNSYGSQSQGTWPLYLLGFKAKQIQHAEKSKAIFMSFWHHQASKLLNEPNPHGPKSCRSVSEHALASMTVIISLQAQSIISTSIEAFLRFLNHFDYKTDPSEANSLILTPEEHLFESPLVGFSVELKVDGNRVRLNVEHEDISEHLVETFQLAIKVFQDIPSLENQIIGHDCHKSSFTWKTDRIHDEHSKAINEIRRVCRKHVVFLDHVCHQHTQILALYQDSILREVLDDLKRAACDTNVCREAIRKLNNAADRLSELSKSVMFLNLFCLDCNQVQVEMHKTISEWFHCISCAYGDITAKRIHALRDMYEDIRNVLASTPRNSHELVAAEMYISELQNSKLQGLEAACKEIETRLSFLILECYQEPPDSIHQSYKEMITMDALSIYRELTRWPFHIKNAVDDAEIALALARRKLEEAFHDHRLTFHREITRLAGQVTTLAEAADLIYPSMYAIQASAIQERLKDNRDTLNMLMEEERVLGIQSNWSVSLTMDDLSKTASTQKQIWSTIRDFQELSNRLSRSILSELTCESDEAILTKMIITLIECNYSPCAGETAIKNTIEHAQLFLDIIKLVNMLLHPAIEDRHKQEMTELLGMHFDELLQLTPLALIQNGVMDQITKVGRICELALFEKEVERTLQEIAAEWRNAGFIFSTQQHVSIRGSCDEMQSMIFSESDAKDLEIMIQDHQIRLETIQCLRPDSVLKQYRDEWMSFFEKVNFLAHKLLICNRQWLSLRTLYCKSYFSGIFKDDDVMICAKWEGVKAAYLETIHRITLHPRCIFIVPAPHSLYTDDGNSLGTEKMSQDDVAVKSRHFIQAIDEVCLEMDSVQQRLRIILDRTRELFPRFHFLSDISLAELLSHLSVTNDQSKARELSILEGTVTSVRKHSKQIKLCFPGADTLQFNAKSHQIIAIVSSQGEVFSVASSITTKNVPVTQWLKHLETCMHRTIHASLRAAMHEMDEKDFKKWCMSWPEQVVLCTICHFWTLQGEAANRALDTETHSQNGIWTFQKSKNAWNLVVKDLNEKLRAISDGMNCAKRPHHRKALEDVIILLRHLRDVSAKISNEVQAAESIVCPHLEKTNRGKSETAVTAKNMENFEISTWLLQPRYYYEENQDLIIRIMHKTSLFYGYEYLGNDSMSFSVKPLTLRYSLALFQTAVHLKRNCCFESDAVSSVGIPTLVHELSKSCGRLWIKFSCQDQSIREYHTLQYDKLMNFARGAASTGAWLLVENAQRIGNSKHQMSQLANFVQLCAKISEKLLSKSPSCEAGGTTISLRRGLQITMIMNKQKLSNPTMERMLSIVRSHFHSIQANLPDFDILIESLLAKAEFQFSRTTILKLSAIMAIVETDLLENGSFDERKLGKDGMTHDKPLALLVRIIARAVQIQSILLENLTLSRYRDTSLNAFGTREKENNLRANKHLEEATSLAEIKQIIISEGTTVSEVQKLESLSLARGSFEILRFNISESVMEEIAELLQQIHPNFEQEVSKIRNSSLRIPLSVRDQYTQVSSHLDKSSSKKLWLDLMEKGSSLEDVVTEYTSTSCVIRASDASLATKTRQLCEVLQLGRLVIVSGKTQAGKSGVIMTLLEACNTLHHIAENVEEIKERTQRQEKVKGALCPRQKQIYSNSLPSASWNNEWYQNKLVASTHQVVIMHQATTWKKFIGLDIFLLAEDCVLKECAEEGTICRNRDLLDQLIWDAVLRHHRNGVHTWLVLDGSIDTSLCEWLIKYTGSLIQRSRYEVLDRFDTRDPVLPDFIRVIAETENLSNVSPSILYSIGYVSVSLQTEGFVQEVPIWHDLYFSWRRNHIAKGTFNSEVLGMLDDLMEEVVTESLNFADANLLSSKAYSDYSRKYIYRNYRMLCRIRQLLEYFEIFAKHQWKQWTALTSLKRNIAISSFFLQALVWGVGNTYDRTEQVKFQAFLREFALKSAPKMTASISSVKSVLLDSFLAKDSTGFMADEKSVYKFGFIIESGNLKWMEWTQYYLHWLESILSSDFIKSDEPNVSDDTSNRMAGVVNYCRAFSKAVTGCRVVSKEHLQFWQLVSKYKKDDVSSLRMPTSNEVAALCILDQVMDDGTQYSALISGPTGSGKTRLGLQYLITREFSHHSSTEASLSCEALHRRFKKLHGQFQHIQLSSGSTADGIMNQMLPFLNTNAHHIYRKKCISDGSPVVLFFDDVHSVLPDGESCQGSPHVQMSIATELVRMIADQKKLFHLSSDGNFENVPGLKVFSSRSISDAQLGYRRSTLDRMSHRFIDIAMPEMSDRDLYDICTEIISHYISLPGTSRLSEQSPLTEDNGIDLKFTMRVAKASVCIFQVVWPSFGILDCRTTDDFSFESSMLSSHINEDVSNSVKESRLSYQSRFACKNSCLFLDSDLISRVHRYHVDDLCQLVRRVCIQAVNCRNTIDISSSWCSEVDRIFGYRLLDPQLRQALVQKARSVASSFFGHLENQAYVIADVAHFMPLLNSASAEGLRQHSVVMAYGVNVLDMIEKEESICNKTIVVYDGRFKGASHIRWLAFFKRIILQCVSLYLSRLPEAKSEPTLLLFQDDGSYDHQASYQLIEWFALGMHRVLENSLHLYRDLSPIFIDQLKSYEALQNQERENRSGFINTGDPSCQFLVSNAIYNIARKNLHIAVILHLECAQIPRTKGLRTRNSVSITSTLRRYSHFFNACNMTFCAPCPDETLISVSEKNLDGIPQLTDQERKLYASVAVQFLQEARKKSETGGDIKELSWDVLGSVVHADLINHHLSIFVDQYERVQCRIRDQLKTYRAAVLFLDELETEFSKQNSHDTFLRAHHQEKSALTWESYGNLEKEKLAIIKAQKQVDVAKDLYRLQGERVSSIEQECKESFQHEELFVHQHQRVKVLADTIIFTMSRLNEENEAIQDFFEKEDNDVERNIESTFLKQFPDLYNVERFSGEQRAMVSINSTVQAFLNLPNHPLCPIFFHLCECLARILHIDAHKKQISAEKEETFDDFMTAVKMQMLRPDFWYEIRDLQISLIKESVLSRVLCLVTTMDISALQNPPLHPFVSVLHDFVKAVAFCLRDRVSSSVILGHLQEERKLLHQSQLHISSVQSVNRSHQSCITDAENLRQDSELARECLAKKIKESTERIKQLESLKYATKDKRKKIQTRFEKLTEASEEWIGDLFMVSAMMTYPEKLIHQFDLLKCWDTILTASAIRCNGIWKKGVISSKMTKHLQQLFGIRKVVLSEWGIQGLPADDPQTVFDVIRVLHTKRIPCLIDPSQVATEWIKNVLIESRSFVISCATQCASSTCNGLLNPAFPEIDEECALCNTIKRHNDLQNRFLLTDFDENAAYHLRFFLKSYQWTRLRSRGRSSQAFLSKSEESTLHQHLGNDVIHQIYVSLSPQSVCTLQEGQCRIRIPQWLHLMDRELHVIYIRHSDVYFAQMIQKKVLEGTGNSYLIPQVDLLISKIITCNKELDILDDQLLALLTRNIDNRNDPSIESWQENRMWNLTSIEEMNVVSSRVLSDRSAYESNLLEKRALEHTLDQVHVKLQKFEGFINLILGIRKAWARANAHSIAFRLTLQKEDVKATSRLADLSSLRIEDTFWLPQTWLLERVGKVMKQHNAELPFELVRQLFLKQAHAYMTSQLQTHHEILYFNFLIACEVIKQDIFSSRFSSVNVFEEYLRRFITVVLYWNASQDALTTLLVDKCTDGPLSDLGDLRPNGVSSQQWQLVQYLANSCEPLHEFILYVDNLTLDAKQRVWDVLMHSNASGWYTESSPSGLSWFNMDENDPSSSPPSCLAPYSVDHTLVRISLAAIFARQHLQEEMGSFYHTVMQNANTILATSISDLKRESAKNCRADYAHSNPSSWRHIKEIWNTSCASQPLTVVATSCEHEAIICIKTIALGLEIKTIQADMQQYAYLAQSTSDKSMFSTAVTSPCAEFRNWILPAMCAGNWVLFPHADLYLFSVSRAIEFIETALHSIDSIHENFRIWFVVHMPKDAQSEQRELWRTWSILQSGFTCELHYGVRYAFGDCLTQSAYISVELMEALGIDTKFERNFLFLAIYHGILVWLGGRSSWEGICDSDLRSVIDIAMRVLGTCCDERMADLNDGEIWSEVTAATVTVYHSKMRNQSTRKMAENLLYSLVTTRCEGNCYCRFSLLPSIWVEEAPVHTQMEFEEVEATIPLLKLANLTRFDQILGQDWRDICSREAFDITKKASVDELADEIYGQPKVDSKSPCFQSSAVEPLDSRQEQELNLMASIFLASCGHNQPIEQ
ncbi:unnamed protein product [Albugo candida]|uniref:Uncharacterized protein n=1 Tax=Albugo candida TaxID=65357 RepID=A0A024FYL0_9STRA|nr:unnamed protein product [Albugo candida]|eukprot:CCI39596.1 unnamed protein product [Albugo candida]